uniref:Uncharacterized protein n=1 Tax=Arundo donax TaxID=35708 RepID=A0A0A9E5B7_ARUDO
MYTFSGWIDLCATVLDLLALLH